MRSCKFWTSSPVLCPGIGRSPTWINPCSGIMFTAAPSLVVPTNNWRTGYGDGLAQPALPFWYSPKLHTTSWKRKRLNGFDEEPMTFDGEFNGAMSTMVVKYFMTSWFSNYNVFRYASHHLMREMRSPHTAYSSSWVHWVMPLCIYRSLSNRIYRGKKAFISQAPRPIIDPFSMTLKWIYFPILPIYWNYIHMSTEPQSSIEDQLYNDICLTGWYETVLCVHRVVPPLSQSRQIGDRIRDTVGKEINLFNKSTLMLVPL